MWNYSLFTANKIKIEGKIIRNMYDDTENLRYYKLKYCKFKPGKLTSVFIRVRCVL